MSNCYSSQAEYEDHNFQGGMCKDCGQVDKPAVKALSAQVSMLEQKVTELTERNRRLANQVVGYQSRVNDSLSEIIRTTKAEALESVRSLIQDLTGNDDDPCQFDHHGGCQAHGYLTLEPGELCPQEQAKRWLRARAEATS